MSGNAPTAPAWQRLLERPRLLHRLATGGLLLAALLSGVDSFVRSAPEVAPDTRAITYVFDAIAWMLVAAGATGEAYVAGLSAPRLRVGGRPHYLIVLTVGLGLSGILCLTLSFFAAASAADLGLAGRVVKAIVAGMLPLVVGVALTAGLAIVWTERLRPWVEARLEAQLRELERRGGRREG